MNLEGMLSISASALEAQKLRMNVISSNLANINSTSTPDGGPYRRKDVVFSSEEGSFGSFLDAANDKFGGVVVDKIVEDNSPFKSIHNPGHPDANEDGYVFLPNINIVEEMVNMMAATRAYEANVKALQATKSMAGRALEIGS